MTKEEKQLLLKDLCGRLPYGVKVKYLYWDEDKGCEYPIAMILDDINSDGYIRFHGDIKEGEGRGVITQYLPYLRSMSSMTEEEFGEYMHFTKHSWEGIDKEEDDYYVKVKDRDVYFDWLLEHHFDYRGLIEKGLALEAPEGMYDR